MTTAPAGGAPRKATTFQLVFMMYAVICSGAYGLEEMISGSGPGMALLTLIVLPFLWSIPISLSCAELSARYPVEGGYYRWARMAFGDFTGYIAGWLVYLAIFMTNATFAVLFGNYLRYWFPDLPHTAHWIIAAGIVWATTWLNWRGIRLVGSASVIMTILIFLPFIGMTILGILQWRQNPFTPFVNPELPPLSAFGAGLMIAIWLYSGYEKLTTNAGEVENPSRAFPIALLASVPLVAATYVLPTLAGLASHGRWADWGESYYSVAAQALGGPVLGAMMASGGLVSNACILMVTILGQSRLPMVLAEDGFFPEAFRRTHPRFGTPTVSLVFGGIVLTFLCRLKFSDLAALFSLVQVFAYLLIYAALLRLRSHPPRAGSGPEHHGGGEPGATAGGFRIPFGRAGIVAMTLPSVILAIFVVLQTVWAEAGLNLPQIAIGALLFGSAPATFFLFRRMRRGSDRG
jgi:amino acid transporter